MGTFDVGTKLIREFGKLGSQNYKKIATQVIEGKTLTQIFNSEGEEILSRVKAIDVSKVGNKIVREKNTVTIGRHEVPFSDRISNYADASRIKKARIYDSEGKLLGGREQVQVGFGDEPLKMINDGDKAVRKYTGNIGTSDNFTKTYFCNGLRNRKDFPYNGYYEQSCLSFNNKGLPIPPSFIESGDAWNGFPGKAFIRAKNKSLKEMVSMAREDLEKVKNTWFGKKRGDRGYYEDFEKCYGNPDLLVAGDKIFYPTQKLNFAPKVNIPETVVQNIQKDTDTSKELVDQLSKYL